MSGERNQSLEATAQVGGPEAREVVTREPDDEEEGYHEMHAAFGKYSFESWQTWVRDGTFYVGVVDILQRYPHLARRLFNVAFSSFDRPRNPFFYILANSKANQSLGVVEKVYHLYPFSKFEKDEEMNSALTVACEYGASVEVVRFLYSAMNPFMTLSKFARSHQGRHISESSALPSHTYGYDENPLILHTLQPRYYDENPLLLHTLQPKYLLDQRYHTSTLFLGFHLPQATYWSSPFLNKNAAIPYHSTQYDVECFVKQCPISMVVTWSNGGGSGLQQSFVWQYCTPAALQRIRAKYPSYREVHVNVIFRLSDVGLPETKMLLDLLPQLSQLVCADTRWSPESWTLLLAAITDSTSIVDLELRLQSPTALNPRGYQHILQRLLRVNTSIQRLILLAGACSTRSQEEYICSIFRAIASNRTLESLQLKNFRFPLLWEDTSVEATNTRPDGPFLKELHLHQCYVPSPDYLSQKLILIRSSLKRITVSTLDKVEHHVDWTTTVVSMLSDYPHLEVLSISTGRGFLIQMDSQPVCQALKRNTCLKGFHVDSGMNTNDMLDVLEVSNTVLEQVGASPGWHTTGRNKRLLSLELMKRNFLYGLASDQARNLAIQERIDHFLLVNRFGRGIARNLATKGELLQLLLRAKQTLSSDQSLRVLYSLLMEAVGVWPGWYNASLSEKTACAPGLASASSTIPLVVLMNRRPLDYTKLGHV